MTIWVTIEESGVGESDSRRKLHQRGQKNFVRVNRRSFSETKGG